MKTLAFACIASLLVLIAVMSDHGKRPERSRVGVREVPESEAVRAPTQRPGLDVQASREERLPEKPVVASVAAPESATGEIADVPPGVEVTGSVRSMAGEPIEEAVLLVLTDGTMPHGQPVGSTDEEGNYHLRDIPVGAELYAAAPGYLSILPRGEDVRGGVGDLVQIDFALEQADGSLKGLVVDQDGKPVPGAFLGVARGGEGSGRRHAEGASSVDLELATLECDAGGAFTVDVSHARRTVLLGRSPSPLDHEVAWRVVPEPVVEAEGTAASILLVLQEGSVVAGGVLDEAGLPLAGARVHTRWLGSESLGGLARARVPALTERDAVVDIAGRYRLDGLFPGEHVLVVRSGGGRMLLETRLAVEAGTQRFLDITVPGTGGGNLDVYVVGPEGNPLPGYRVAALLVGTHKGPEDLTLRSTDEAGRCTLEGLEEKPHALVVFGPASQSGLNFPVALEREVWPGGQVTVTAAVGGDATGSLSGRVVKAGGRAASGGQVRLLPLSFPMSFMCTLNAEGRFELNELPPGTYEVTYYGESLPAPSLGYHVVPAGGAVNLGDCVLPNPGGIRVRLLPPTDVPVQSPQLALFAVGASEEPIAARRILLASGAPGAGLQFLFGGGEAASDNGGAEYDYSPLSPGEYELLVTSTNHCPLRRRVRVHEGRRIEIEVALERGLPVTVIVDVSGLTRSQHLSVGLAVFNHEGDEVIPMGEIRRRVAPDVQSVELELELVPERYRLEVACASSEVRRRSKQIEVDLGEDGSAKPIRVGL